MSILAQIAKGEGKTIEFKEKLPASDQLAKTIVAFANTAGGKLLVGVKDDGAICGVDNILLPDYMDRVSNMLHDKIHPLAVPDIYSYAIGEKNIIVVEVYQSSLKPHFLKNLGKVDGTYIRVGATNKKADLEYIQELERQRLNLSFDEDICIDRVDNQAIIKELQDLLSVRLNRIVSPEQLLNLKLLKNQQGQVYLTNAAPILLGKPEHVAIKCARFKGDDNAVFIDRKELTGDIFTQLEEAMKFLLSQIHLNGELGPDHLRRIDTYEIPPDALREALVNAVVHRDYLMSGSDIKIAVYDSKIEITSPGSFPKGITLDEILSGRSEIRNKVIARVFKEGELIEQWGRGIQQINRLCLESGLKQPDITESGMFVQIRFYRKEYSSLTNKNKIVTGRKERTIKTDDKTGRKGRTIKIGEKINSSLQQDKVLEYLRQHDSITTAIAMQLLSLGKSRTAEILAMMAANGVIIKKGVGRATCYCRL